jgi:hypothetical protein
VSEAFWKLVGGMPEFCRGAARHGREHNKEETTGTPAGFEPRFPLIIGIGSRSNIVATLSSGVAGAQPICLVSH